MRMSKLLPFALGAAMAALAGCAPTYDPGTNMVGGGLGGAAIGCGEGAIVGSIVPGIGTAVGCGAGAAIGAVNGGAVGLAVTPPPPPPSAWPAPPPPPPSSYNRPYWTTPDSPYGSAPGYYPSP
jgi:hypothetical protein